MSSWLGKLHENTKWMPEHYGLDVAQKSSTDIVKGGAKLFGNDYAYGKADKDSNDFGRWGENNLAGIGAILGGMYAYGAGGAGGAAAGGAGEAAPAVGNGAFLGEGVSTGIPAWDGAAGGAGLGFDSGGLPASASSGNMDIPGGNTGKMPEGIGGLNNMGSMFGGGQKQGGYSGGGRQNLPLFQNEKSDQQKLAELLQALQEQEGA